MGWCLWTTSMIRMKTMITLKSVPHWMKSTIRMKTTTTQKSVPHWKATPITSPTLLEHLAQMITFWILGPVKPLFRIKLCCQTIQRNKPLCAVPETTKSSPLV